MYIVENYFLAVVFCIVTMICWGSWGNTQKLAAKNWRYELYYWDYVIGIVLLSVLIGFTLGSWGTEGRPFIPDLMQVSATHFGSAFIGGVIFNAANILLSTAISLAGMSVAFPVGVGLALILGVFINFFNAPKGDPIMLFAGVALIMVAIIVNGMAANKMNRSDAESKSNRKGILIAIVAGILMSLFYRFVASAMDLENFVNPTPGMATPYSAFFIFSLGILVSNFLFNTLVMKHPFIGKPTSYKAYFKGGLGTHMVGILGGVIWGVGTALSYISAEKAGPAISYALGQGAPMVAALWGVFVWREFKGGSTMVRALLTLMFILFITGLSLIVVAGMAE